ncbi:MAG: phage major capsid protein [Phycisphaerae bacterium]|nr:phage major capsid protein [Phycisphaerae bacterium]
MAKDASDAGDAETTVREVGERIKRQFDAAVKGMKEFEEKLKHHTEQLGRLGGEKVEGDATLAEQVAAQKTASEEVRKLVEQYSKQMPLLSRAGGGGERDSEYSGFWPNEERAAQFGQTVLASVHPNADLRRAHATWLLKAGLTVRDAKGQLVESEDYVKAMGEGAGTTGGYLVADELMTTIIRHVEQFGVARKRLTKAPMSSDRQSWPKRASGFTVYYPDEGVSPTASDLALGKVTLTAKKWAVLTFMSKELEEDSVVALGELVALEMALALSQAEDTNCFMGDGTSSYAGIVGVFGSPNVGVVTMGSGDTTFDKLDYGDLIDLKRAVPSWVRKQLDCAYFMSPDIAGLCEKMVDQDGRPQFQSPTEAFPLRISGHEVVESSVLPDITDSAAATKFLAFGSLFSWGILGVRRAMSLERSMEVKWLEDQIAIKAVPRQDIQEATGEAMAVLKTAAS